MVKVSRVALIRPPIMTTAKGLAVSDPKLVTATGIKPNIAIMTTGRNGLAEHV